jgi:Concanavalin A-like lectin/glucanases superfamily
MIYKINTTQLLPVFLLALMALGGCQKMKRPSLGDYPQDANAPGGPLKFYTAFNGTSADPLRNAVDSIRATFATSNPLVSIDGVSGKGIKGSTGKDKAIKYPSANDFAGSTSWTIAYWMKNVPATDGEPEFHFSLASKDYWHESGLFLLVEKGHPSDRNLSTPDSMACKLAIEDNWIEFIGSRRLPTMLNGQWHHLVFVYDATDSRVRAYVDGVLRVTSDPVPKNGSPRGARPFGNTGNLVVGGWNKHAGVSGAGDSWIHAYSGEMDQFRLYGKALSASEVQALFNSRL